MRGGLAQHKRHVNEHPSDVCQPMHREGQSSQCSYAALAAASAFSIWVQVGVCTSSWAWMFANVGMEHPKLQRAVIPRGGRANIQCSASRKLGTQSRKKGICVPSQASVFRTQFVHHIRQETQHPLLHRRHGLNASLLNGLIHR